MSIAAWIILGLAGSVTGGWTASILLVRPLAGGLLSLATWPAAIAPGH